MAVLCFVLLFGTVVFTACGTDEQNPPSGEVTLERIAVTKKPTKTEYTEGDNFSRAGMVVTAYYSDGSDSTVMGYTVDKTGALTTADTKVTVTYKEKSDSFDIIVNAKQISTHLEITTADTYTYKVEAEVCDLASEALGTPKETYIETHSATKNNPNTSGGASLGNLNFSNNRISLKINSTVEADISIEMCMAYNPSLDYDANTKTEWNGKQLTTGITVAVAEGAPYVWFDWHEYALDDLRLEVGINTLDLTILDLSANYDYFKINVNPVKSALTGITVTTPPSKTVYSEGENFSPEGMVVTASYDDGSSVAVNDYTVDKTKLSVGDTEVTVTYKGMTATVPVTVHPRTAAISEIDVTGPIKTAYVAGDYFRTAGMAVTAIYSDGTNESVTDYSIDKNGPLAVSDTAVVVSYEGKTASVPITVSEGAGTRQLTIENGNTATYRIEAEDALIYKNRDSDAWQIEEHSESKGNPNTSGLKSLGYLNLTTTGIKLVIESDVDAVVSVTMGLAYKPSLQFDNETASYWNGNKITTGFTVAQTNSTFDWFDWKPYTTGSLELKQGINILEFITLGNISAGYDYFDINVNPATDIAVTTQPAKTDYTVGERFDPAGMVVTATYADGSTGEITDYTVDTTSALSSDVTSVAVHYKGLTASVAVTVTEPAGLDRLEIMTQPSKTEYYAGQPFDAAGMSVKAFYSDGSSAEITNYTMDKTILGIGDDKVTVSYGGKDAIIDVTVKTHITISEGTADYKLEFEDALFAKGTGDKMSYTLTDKAEASGGKFVDSMDWLSGASFTITINSEIEGTVSIKLGVAHPDFDLDANTSISWNAGEKIATGIRLDSGWTDFRDFTSDALSGLTLKQGLNTFVITLTSDQSANYDYISFSVGSTAD